MRVVKHDGRSLGTIEGIEGTLILLAERDASSNAKIHVPLSLVARVDYAVRIVPPIGCGTSALATWQQFIAAGVTKHCDIASPPYVSPISPDPAESLAPLPILIVIVAVLILICS